MGQRPFGSLGRSRSLVGACNLGVLWCVLRARDVEGAPDVDENMQPFYAGLAKRAESEDYCPIDILPLPRETDADVEAFLERAIADNVDP